MLSEHRFSPSTVEFTYSLQPRPSTLLPTVSNIVDLITSLVQSTFILLVTQWSTTRLDSNRIVGGVLRYVRHLLPYNDIRIVQTVRTPWEITPWGMMAISCLGLFLFFSKSVPLGGCAQRSEE